MRALAYRPLAVRQVKRAAQAVQYKLRIIKAWVMIDTSAG